MAQSNFFDVTLVEADAGPSPAVPRRWATLGALAVTLGLVCVAWSPAAVGAALQLHTRPLARSALAASGANDVDAADVLSGEWPAHNPMPKKLAHPHPQAHQAHESHTLLEDVDPEMISGEWPAHALPPKKLAHPHKEAHASHTLLEDVDPEMLSGEWPAHALPPKKLAHPHKEAHESHTLLEDVDPEMISGEWPAHALPPKKLAHPHKQAHESHTLLEDVDPEMLSGEWPSHALPPRKLAHPHKDAHHGDASKPKSVGQSNKEMHQWHVLGLMAMGCTLAAVTGQMVRRADGEDYPLLEEVVVPLADENTPSN